MTVVAGADGARSGWVLARWDLETNLLTLSLVGRFAELLQQTINDRFVAIDVIIGLPDRLHDGGRACDQLLRDGLLKTRRSSVFPAPARAVLDATSHAEACAINRAHGGKGISIQLFNVLRKIREADTYLFPELQSRVREAHPEACFATLNGGIAVVPSKKTAEGRQLRTDLLLAAGAPVPFDQLRPITLGSTATVDDVLDAIACCECARRMAHSAANRVPAVGKTPCDARGLCMEIWF